MAVSTEPALKARKRAVPTPRAMMATSRPPSSPCFFKTSRSSKSGPLPIPETPTFLSLRPLKSRISG